MTNQPHKRIVIGCWRSLRRALTACGSDDPTSTREAPNARRHRRRAGPAGGADTRNRRRHRRRHRRRRPPLAGRRLERRRCRRHATSSSPGWISLREHDGTAAGIAAFIDDFRAMAAGVPSVAGSRVHRRKRGGDRQLDAVTAEADGWLACGRRGAGQPVTPTTSAGDAALGHSVRRLRPRRRHSWRSPVRDAETASPRGRPRPM